MISTLKSTAMAYYESILEDLKDIRPDTLIGLTIQNVIDKNDQYATMDLIAGLQSQAKDNPKMMMGILGKKAYKKIMAVCNS